MPLVGNQSPIAVGCGCVRLNWTEETLYWGLAVIWTVTVASFAGPAVAVSSRRKEGVVNPKVSVGEGDGTNCTGDGSQVAALELSVVDFVAVPEPLASVTMNVEGLSRRMGRVTPSMNAVYPGVSLRL